MFARVSTFRSTDGDRLLEGFQSVAEELEDVDGFSHAYFLIDREGGDGMAVTLWESEDALSASTAKADDMRKRGSDTGGAQIESVKEFEVGLTVGSPTTAG